MRGVLKGVGSERGAGGREWGSERKQHSMPLSNAAVVGSP